MTEFFEAFNPGARHLREQKEFMKVFVAPRKFSGRGPRPLDLDSGKVLLVKPGEVVAGAAPLVRVAVGRDAERAARVGVRAVLDGSDLHHTDPFLDEVRDVARRQRDGELLVAVLDGTVVATATWCPPGSPLCRASVGEQAEMSFLAVDPSMQGRGLGRLMVTSMVERSREAGAPELVAATREWMTAGRSLLRRMGFSRDGDLFRLAL